MDLIKEIRLNTHDMSMLNPGRKVVDGEDFFWKQVMIFCKTTLTSFSFFLLSLGTPVAALISRTSVAISDLVNVYILQISSDLLPSRKLIYPTLGKGKSSSKVLW